MKRKYLATLALAGVLVFCGLPVVASASSVNAGGTIVDGARDDAGDTLELDNGEEPPDAGEDEVTQDIGDGQVPLDAGEGEEPQEDIGEGDVPLAVMSNEAESSKRGWVPYAVGGAATAAVAGTGIWAAVHAGAVGAAKAGAAGAAKAGAAKAGAHGWRFRSGSKRPKKK